MNIGNQLLKFLLIWAVNFIIAYLVLGLGG